MEVIYTVKVRKFVESLDDVLAYRITRSIDYLEQYGNLLGMPISKPLGRGLFELRITGNNHIRIFYCFHEGVIYLLHAIFKQQQSIPRKDIEYARKLMKGLQ